MDRAARMVRKIFLMAYLDIYSISKSYLKSWPSQLKDVDLYTSDAYRWTIYKQQQHDRVMEFSAMFARSVSYCYVLSFSIGLERGSRFKKCQWRFGFFFFFYLSMIMCILRIMNVKISLRGDFLENYINCKSVFLPLHHKSRPKQPK